MIITELLKLLKCENFKYYSDNMRYDILKNAMANGIKQQSPPDYNKLIDDWDGYDDQTYIQIKDNTIIFYEGWVKACWNAIKLKPEYNNLSKPEIIESIINKRFKNIAEKLNLTISKYQYFKHKNVYIMKIELQPK